AAALFAHDPGARRGGALRALVGRGVVEHHDLGPGQLAAEVADDLGDRGRFVEAGNGDGDAQSGPKLYRAAATRSKSHGPRHSRVWIHGSTPRTSNAAYSDVNDVSLCVKGI